MASHIPDLDYNNDPDYMLNRMVKSSLYCNPYMTIKEHVNHVIKSFQLVENALKLNKTGPYTNSNIMQCPKHGWIFCLKRMSSNRCPKCFRERLFRKRKLIIEASLGR